MATQLQIRRGTTAQMGAFTGAEGELAVNTSTDTVHVHDGATAGGFALAKADGSNIGTYAGSFTTLAASGASTLTGAVGINIAPTSYKLTVNSGATTETTAAAIGYNGDNGTNLYINTDHGNNLVSLYASGSASKQMRFLSGTLEVMRLGTTGNVGVGTGANAISHQLVSYKSGANANYVQIASGSTGLGATNGLRLGVSSAGIGEIYSQSASPVMTFNANNVGIGASSPSSTFRASIYGDGSSVIGGIEFRNAASGGSTFTIGHASAASPSATLNVVDSANLIFKTSNTERLRLDAGGDVKLVTANDTAGTSKFLTFGTLNYNRAGIKCTNAATYDGSLEFYTGNASNFAERVRIDSAGNLLVGTTGHFSYSGSTTEVTVGTTATGATAGGAVTFVSNNGSTTLGYIGFQESEAAIGTMGARPLTFKTNNTERLRIDSGGDVFIASSGVNPSASQTGFAYRGGAGGYGFIATGVAATNALTHHAFYNPNGVCGQIYTTGSSTVYAQTSDYRLKENVVGITGATQRLLQLKPSRFNFIADANTTVDGFLAHEIADVVPEAIVGTKDAVDADGNPDYQGIDQSKLVPLLVATIQELEARLTALENN